MRVRTFATLRDLMGVSQIDIPIQGRAPARDVLRTLAQQYPVLRGKLWDDQEKPTGQITVLLNGRALEFLSGMETEVTNEDTLSLFPPVGGG